MSTDPFEGLDADERLQAEEALAAEGTGGGGSTTSNRRVIGVLAFFVIAYLPVVLGATWLANTVVYEPLCGRDGDVASIQQADADLTTGGQPAACIYTDGREVPLADLIGTVPDFVLNLLVTAFRFGLPFLVVYLVVLLLPSRERQ